MPPVDRNKPKQAESSESRYTLMEFMREFPDDATCLEWLWRNRYSEDGEHADCPKCETAQPFKRYETAQQRQSWTCTACGYHSAPHGGDDLPQVLYVAAPVVLRHVPDDQHTLRYLREAA